MLVLSRKLDEAVQIGGGIRVKILHISDGQVKIGIEAPPDVKIYRAEIVSEIERQNVLAARGEKSAAAKAAGMLTKSAAKPKQD
ncbi:MAG: carbon storage regulator CsrA [Bacteroidetes bacterium]|nr:carbon storage regulator CsrA [Bacteroidota bacterium]MCW5895077.1 carbon storage regulator CsrA [Bacteroidota bacterium]